MHGHRFLLVSIRSLYSQRQTLRIRKFQKLKSTLRHLNVLVLLRDAEYA